MQKPILQGNFDGKIRTEGVELLPAIHGRKASAMLIVAMDLDGLGFPALNRCCSTAATAEVICQGLGMDCTTVGS